MRGINLNTYSNIYQNTFKFQEKFWIFYHLYEVWKSKISIMSLLNDLGINKVPKENKNKEYYFPKFLEIIILNKNNTILNMKIFKIVYKST
jgi:hypothetical protein